MATHTFTRKELYDLVWTEPMTKLAARYKISGNGLAKACKRANVPVPPRGYWAKLQAGKEPERTPLPEAGTDTPWSVVIKPPKEQEQPAPPSPAPRECRGGYGEYTPDHPPIVVPSTLRNPHKIVAQWLADNKRERSDEHYRYRRWKPDAINGTPLERRRLRILSTLFKGMETCGYKLIAEDHNTHPVQIIHKTETLEITLHERIQQKRRKLTDEDRKERSYYSDTQVWTTEQIQTGTPIFKIGALRSYSLKKEWRESEEEPLETKLNEILAETSGLFEQMLIVTRKRHEEEMKRWEESKERARLKQERELEELKFRRLLELVQNRKQADDIREFVSAIKTARASLADPKEYAAFKVWALAHADRIDPMKAEDLFLLRISPEDRLRTT